MVCWDIRDLIFNGNGKREVILMSVEASDRKAALGAQEEAIIIFGVTEIQNKTVLEVSEII